jgi:hypothetical protein
MALAMGAKWYLFDSGWTWLSFKELTGRFWTPLEHPYDPSRIIIGDAVPNYTTDERHAFQALDWLRRQKGILPKIEQALDGTWCVVLVELGAINPKRHMTHNQSLPLAISEAFLRCLNLWEESK